MSLYSSTYLKALSRNLSESSAQNLASVSTELTTTYDLFLSHSYLDREEVRGLYLELTILGFKVYVDWIVDPWLDRNDVTKATANYIRYRLKMSKALLLAVSGNALDSKWIPWELGYMDAHTGKCAIIPVSREITTPKSFSGFEYLGLYPFIKKLPNTEGLQKLWVIDDAMKYIVFDDWYYNNKQPTAQLINIFSL